MADARGAGLGRGHGEQLDPLLPLSRVPDLADLAEGPGVFRHALSVADVFVRRRRTDVLPRDADGARAVVGAAIHVLAGVEDQSRPRSERVHVFPARRAQAGAAVDLAD